jgi:WD40 repeat protein
MKKSILWIGIFPTLLLFACAPGVSPAESPSRSLALSTVEGLPAVTEAFPTLTPPNLTPQHLTPDTSTAPSSISPATASQVKLLATLHNDTLTSISQLTWRPDGKALLVNAGGALTLLETGTWNPLWSIPSGGDARFTPDGRELLLIAAGEIQRRDSASGELLSSHPIQPEGMFALSPDGKVIASTQGGGFTLTDVASGQVIRTLPADLNSGPTADLAFSADGSKIVAGSQNGDLQAWDAQSGQRTLFRPAVLPAPLYECEVSGAMDGQPDGALLVICSYPASDYSLAYYQVGVYPATTTAQGSSAVIRDTDLRGYRGFTVNADRSRLAVFGGKDLELWSAFGGSRLLTLADAAGDGMTFNPAEKRLLAVWSKRSIQIWDTASGQKVDEWRRGGSDSPPVALAFSPLPTSRLLAVAREDGWLELWDAASAEKAASWKIEPPRNGYGNPEPAFKALAFSPDGRWLAVSSERGWNETQILLFEPSASLLSPRFTLQSKEQAHALAFSPDSRLLYAIGNFSNNITAWDVETQTIAAAWTPGAGSLLNLTVRGGTLAVVSESGLVTAWDNPPSGVRQEIQLSYAWGRLLALSPDGKQALIQHGYDLDIWSFDTRKWLRGWAFQSGAPYPAYSPDGCTLAVSAGKDLGLLDTLQGEFYKLLGGQTTELVKSPPAFSADGALLAAAYADGRIAVWGLETALASPAGTIPPARCGSFSLPPTPAPTATPTQTPIPSATLTPTATLLVTATFTPTPPPFTRTLSLTDPPMRGEDVLLLQQRLLELGYAEVGAPDGVFGKMTRDAVARFQQDHGLEPDGFVGPKTWEKLFH